MKNANCLNMIRMLHWLYLYHFIVCLLLLNQTSHFTIIRKLYTIILNGSLDDFCKYMFIIILIWAKYMFIIILIWAVPIELILWRKTKFIFYVTSQCRFKYIQKNVQESLYQCTSLSVSLFVCLFPNSSKTASPSELKIWGMIPLGMRKVLG